MITDHAYERAKDRLGWSKKTLARMSLKAIEKDDIVDSDSEGTKLLYGGIYYIYNVVGVLITVVRVDEPIEEIEITTYRNKSPMKKKRIVQKVDKYKGGIWKAA